MSARRCVVVVFVLFIVTISLSACCGLPCGSLCGDLSTRRLQVLRGSGNTVTRDMDLSGFTRLEISHAFRVYLTQSDRYEVIITADDNMWDALDVFKSGNTLKIGVDPGAFSVQNVTLEAEISMPSLERASVSGASRLTGEMDTGDITLEVSGASRLTLGGSGGDLRIDASGASQVDLAGFVVGDADVEASGASTVTVHVTGRLNADASGASRVEYLGDPRLGNIDTSGASSVRPK
jgi:hypothetical protein